MVYANKQDLQFAAEAEEILNALKLQEINDRTWNIQACSAVTKEGKYIKFIYFTVLFYNIFLILDITQCNLKVADLNDNFVFK